MEPEPKRCVAFTGASGLVGRAWTDALRASGDEVRPLKRGSDWGMDHVEPGALQGVDAVVHLAGESVFGRWSKRKKRAILESRDQGTRTIAEAVSAAGVRTLICASAIGYYGAHDEQVLDESAPPGSGFLAEVCERWETAADPARQAGARLAHLRIGVVLDRSGGALAKMLTPFRLGLGGRVGSGRQWMSWITLDDLVRAGTFILDHDTISGPINGTAPNPVTNADFTRALGKVLRRPTLVPLPGFVARLVFGEFANEALLVGQRVVPGVLQQQGFEFQHSTIDAALEAVLR